MFFRRRGNRIVWGLLFVCVWNVTASLGKDPLEVKERVPEVHIKKNSQFLSSDAYFQRTKRSLKLEEYNERHVTSTNSLISTLNQIEIYPKVAYVGSETLNLSWEVTPLAHLTSFQTIDESIGLKVKYRSFGSTMERELILVTNSKDLTGNSHENNYVINTLLPGKGYVICFSLIDQDEIIGALESDGYSQSTSENFSEFPKHIQTVTPINADENEITTSSSLVNDYSLPEMSTRINLDQTSKQTTREISNTASTTISTTTSESPVFINHAGAFPSRPAQNYPQNSGSFAYTSTGDLIYLPGKAWSPRNKRSFQKKTHNSFSGKQEFCTEIFTKELEDLVSWNPLIILITLLVVFGILISLGIMYCLKSCLCKGFLLSKWLKNKLRPTVSQTTHNKTDDVGNVEHCEQHNENESSKIPCHCRNSSLPSYQEILSRHEQRENMKGTLRMGKNLSFDSLKFHPGYDLPPMSTNEVYGYDIPKFSNKGTKSIPTPSIAHSCDLNDRDNEFSWNCQEIENLNTSDLKKYVGYRKDLPSEIPQDQTESPPPIFPRVRHKSITELNFDPVPVPSEEIPLYKYTSRVPPTSINSTDREEPSSVNLLEGSSMKDEVTVTGGTLIEVPEGYAVPNSSKCFKLIVNTNPVYI